METREDMARSSQPPCVASGARSEEKWALRSSAIGGWPVRATSNIQGEIATETIGGSQLTALRGASCCRPRNRRAKSAGKESAGCGRRGGGGRTAGLVRWQSSVNWESWGGVEEERETERDGEREREDGSAACETCVCVRVCVCLCSSWLVIQ